jgi:excisionase family DNA binding protein
MKFTGATTMELKLDHTNRDSVNFDLKEASTLLNLTPSQVKKLVKDGKLSGFKCGSLWWITRKSMEQFLAN